MLLSAIGEFGNSHVGGPASQALCVPLDDGRLDLGAVARVDAQLDTAVGDKQPIAGMEAPGEAGKREHDVGRDIALHPEQLAHGCRD